MLYPIKENYIKELSFEESVGGLMSEQNTFVASDATVGQNHKSNRKEAKQISFRVSESEFRKEKGTGQSIGHT